ncbi:hypothetical protein MLD38_009144 [Melastoma candidum]|uniref:Uncharacterized protein n=1 Tax=Melastoma candidum TaxID=119954 RepID=A0ACB9RY03_9MYRT|nr:hypothetical protein MLD38_009144 [Melastoma candidum]
MVDPVSILLTFLFVFALSPEAGANSTEFNELFRPAWAPDHFLYDGNVLNLKLDSYSGAGFASKSKYMFGKVTLQMRLVGGDSAGTVTAFYMSSEGPNHNEFDFEFLGNTTGEPYLVQTNLYVNGIGNREQRHSLWFNPTEDFHSYSISWNPRRVLFLVDDILIRQHTNLEQRGIPFPKDQPMGVYSSIWNADDWATQGGRVKTDWSHSPFLASYKGFKITACEYPVPTAVNKCSTGNNHETIYLGDEARGSSRSQHRRNQLKWVQVHHRVYDYCTDTTRFPVAPAECEHHRH